MGRLFLTGDTHGDIDLQKLSIENFPIQEDLTKEDILVVLGDWGAIWRGGERDKPLLEWWETRPWTTFVVLGNHCNYDEIERLPSIQRFGDEGYKVSESIFIAKTGGIYTLNEKKCFVINGADSHDLYNEDGTYFRKPHISWWEQEKITDEDVNKAIEKLNSYNGKIDCIFSHTGGSKPCHFLGFKPTESDLKLDTILAATYNYDKRVENCKHYCGHYHYDKIVSPNMRILYQDIILV